MKTLFIILLAMFKSDLDNGGYDIIKYNKTVIPSYTIIDYTYDYVSEIILVNYYKIIDNN